MASTNKSTSNQGTSRYKPGGNKAATGTRGGPKSQGRNPTVSRRPKLAVNLKNSQGTGGGIKQGASIASAVKRVQSASQRGPSKGPKQGGSISSATKRFTGKTGKLNLTPVKQPSHPKNLGVQAHSNGARHNTVAKSDVTRLRKASSMPVPTTGGGGFKAFIGGN